MLVHERTLASRLTALRGDTQSSLSQSFSVIIGEVIRGYRGVIGGL